MVAGRKYKSSPPAGALRQRGILGTECKGRRVTFAIVGEAGCLSRNGLGVEFRTGTEGMKGKEALFSLESCFG